VSESTHTTHISALQGTVLTGTPLALPRMAVTFGRETTGRTGVVVLVLEASDLTPSGLGRAYLVA